MNNLKELKILEDLKQEYQELKILRDDHIIRIQKEIKVRLLSEFIQHMKENHFHTQDNGDGSGQASYGHIVIKIDTGNNHNPMCSYDIDSRIYYFEQCYSITTNIKREKFDEPPQNVKLDEDKISLYLNKIRRLKEIGTTDIRPPAKYQVNLIKPEKLPRRNPKMEQLAEYSSFTKALDFILNRTQT